MADHSDLAAHDCGEERRAVDVGVQGWFQRAQEHPGGRIWISPALQNRHTKSGVEIEFDLCLEGSLGVEKKYFGLSRIAEY